MAIRVVVEVLNSADRVIPEGEKTVTVELDEGQTVSDAMRAAGARDDAAWNAAINGTLVYGDTELKDGDRILVFAPIHGG